ncbi:isocitrate lyase/PEP mutase family protein [Neobacillus sp. MM2021_6]|uniref:isocitrate lyase/PEP mutase family protein n=1 Tax=Bacillaceae TaxID=186817 RepID=UPI00140D8C41|nr:MULTISPECIES: isocitrate lyase/PEP mutase family protein [Bacillaceae]MBO0959927.1 isocitrate lyase/PEP mutase family protein [Neobacillus sp. MM2021_6]NHC18876.1 isocitrate lyase/PEP mutase family protein [Bacillus sp. MM2020_4]
MSSKAKLLRKLIHEKEFIYTAGAYDSLSAIMIENAGFDAVFTTGFGVSASALGLPDAELYTATENLQVVQNIVNAVSAPVIADADTGYGNAINVMRTVRSFEKAGVAGITLEDQVVPKRCPLGINSKPELISLEEGVAKIRAAVDAREDKDFVIIARTDAEGEEASKRANAYIEAGADFIQPLSYVNGNEYGLVTFGQSVSVPLSVQMTVFAPKGLPEELLREMNCKFIHFPLVPLLLSSAAIQNGLNELVKYKKTDEMRTEMMPLSEFKDIIKFKDIERLQDKYLSALPKS